MNPPERNPTPSPAESWLWQTAALLQRYRLPLLVLATLLVFGLSSIPFRTPMRAWRLDKLMHVLEYLLVGLAYLNFITQGYRRLNWSKAAVYLLLLATLAALDEFYQRLVPGRSPDWRDWLASIGGGLVALALTAWISRKVAAQQA